MRRGAAFPAATASNATIAMAMCPDNAVIKLGSGKGFEFNYDYLQGLWHLCPGMPVRGH